MSCVFCDIVDGRATAAHVMSDAHAVAFLDKTPLFHGHVLVVPRQHVETLHDLELSEVGPLFERVQRVARAVVAATGAEGTFVAMNNKVSQSVAHLHVHVVPRKKKDGLRGFFWPRTKYASPEQMQETAGAIARALSAT
ncbi:MAG: HIT family protein [Myxococcales bacterium]|nr:HIT family protein [Myxococcales bacterium]